MLFIRIDTKKNTEPFRDTVITALQTEKEIKKIFYTVLHKSYQLH